jgi:D-arabinose 1-dehydrogenase-like Zn-dependent alcohol dehydrogenase
MAKVQKFQTSSLTESIVAFSQFVRTHGLNVGIQETQEMLDYCAEHNIVSTIELVDASDASAIDAAYKRVVDSDVRYRFVIDASTI